MSEKISEGTRQAIDAALRGPEVKRLNVHNHHFNVKKATITRTGNTITIAGRISHNVRGRPDEQVDYTILKEGTKVKDIQLNVSGGLGDWLSKLSTVFGYLSSDPRAQAAKGVVGASKPFVERAAKLLDGNWTGVVRYIIANIAEEAA
jgi:hypothetical protein